MKLLRRLRFWFDARRQAADLAAELEDHRARLQAAFEGDGLDPVEAAVRSRRAMGNVTLAREDARDVWAAAALGRAWRDAVYGIRALRREPTFAATALLTLTLGCVTTITVFSIADAELWRPLPFPDAHRLFVVSAVRPGVSFEDIPGPDFADWVRECRLAAFVAELSPTRRVLNAGSPEAVLVLPVTTNFFTVLGRSPSPGRGFTPDDARSRTTVVSDPAWRRLFNADPSVVGRTVTLDDRAYTIVGIAADARLEFRSEPDFFVPIDPTSPIMRDRAARELQVYGRVAPGATLGQAEAELRAVHARVSAAFPAGHEGETLRLLDLQDRTGNNWRQLYLFLGGAALLTVLSCLNVANLLLSRALRRQREFAIRGALGGGTGALVRQLLVEGAVLAIPSALAGWLGATWLVRAFVAIVPSDLLQRGGDVSPDARVTIFTVVLTAAITLALALSPLVFARRINLNVMLGHGSRSVGRTPRQRAVRTGLLVAQVSATLVLLVGAGLFGVSFVRLTASPLGFDPRDRVVMRLSLPAARYADDAARLRFAEHWLAEARAVPGVREAAVASETPLTPRGIPSVKVAVPGRPRPEPGNDPAALIFSVSPQYFTALDIPLLDGRTFGRADVTGSPRVAIVNELFARRFFPGQRAIGQTVEIIPRVTGDSTNRPGLVTIVGIVGNVRNFSVDEVAFSNLYLPFTQVPAPAIDLVAATAIPAAGAIQPLRDASQPLDPGLPLASVTLGTDRVSTSLRGARFNLSLIAVFAALALTIAGVGVYGSMACAVEERAREFGVRMALGAAPRAILREALLGSVRVGFAGALVGTFAVVVLARIVGSAFYLVPGKHAGLLYSVSTTDSGVLAAACLILIGAASAAGLVPARQATRVDPLVVLRTD